MKENPILSGKLVKCFFCNKDFYKMPSRMTEKNFCSRKCQQVWTAQQAIQRIKNLSKDKQRYLHRLKTIRESNLYKLWRDAVYKKDHYTCQICKKHFKQLIAHHIKNFKEFPELRFAIDNGITLCRKCHNRLHYSKLSKC